MPRCLLLVLLFSTFRASARRVKRQKISSLGHSASIKEKNASHLSENAVIRQELGRKSPVDAGVDVLVTRHGLSAANIMDDRITKEKPPEGGVKKISHLLWDAPLLAYAEHYAGHDAAATEWMDCAQYDRLIVVSSVLTRAKQTAFAQFFRPWSQRCASKLHPQIIVAPLIKEEGSTANNLPFNMEEFSDKNVSVPGEAVKCVSQEVSGLFDYDLLKTKSDAQGLKSDAQRGIDYVVSSVLSKLAIGRGKVAIAIACHSKIMAEYFKKPNQNQIAMGRKAWWGKKPNNNQVVRMTLPRLSDGALDPQRTEFDSPFQGQKEAPLPENAGEIKEFVGVDTLKLMQAALSNAYGRTDYTIDGANELFLEAIRSA